MSDAAAKVTQQQAEDDLKEARARWREQETIRTLEFQKEQFDFVAGPPRRYVGFKVVADGVTVITAEWTTVVSTTTLPQQEVLSLIATLQSGQ